MEGKRGPEEVGVGVTWRELSTGVTRERSEKMIGREAGTFSRRAGWDCWDDSRVIMGRAHPAASSGLTLSPAGTSSTGKL